MIETESQQKIRWQVWAAGAGILLLAVIGTWMVLSGRAGSILNKPPTMTAAEFEQATGIRITLIAVTGGGGMIDFRIKVLDGEKATELFANPENKPILIAEDGNIELSPPAEVDFKAKMEADQIYYTLYANVNSAVKRGAPVTVLIGDYRLEPIPAQ